MDLYINKDEVWKKIKDYENYEISSYGRVKGGKYNRIMSQYSNGKYLNISLCKNSKQKNFRVNRLVCINFIDNPENKRTSDHININSFDNRLVNLRWATQAEQNNNQNIHKNHNSIFDNIEIINEEWKPIPSNLIYDAENYQISNYGRVKNPKNKILKGGVDMGYVIYHFKKNTPKIKAHVLVGSLYIPNTENKKILNHIDGNKLNNHISNLEWTSHSENTQHAIDSGLLDIKKSIIQYDLNDNKINEFDSIIEASNTLNISYQGISRCCNKQQITAGGFKFTFKEDKHIKKINVLSEKEILINKEKKNKRQKKTYNKNKDKILERKKIQVECECGCIVRKNEISRHRKTKKHIQLMEQKNK